MICDRFSEFGTNPKIKCLSLLVESVTEESDKADQVSRWWQDYEQKSIEMSLDYDFIIQTDIVDCYPAIYTHSIAWALHAKTFAKTHRDDKMLIGNIIDSHLQDMLQGQTNGIPKNLF